MTSPTPLSEAAIESEFQRACIGLGEYNCNFDRIWAIIEARDDEIEILRAALTAAQEAIKERDRTYLAVQKAWEAERDSWVSKETGNA